MSRVLSNRPKYVTAAPADTVRPSQLGIVSLALWFGLFAGYLEFGATHLYDLVSGGTRQQSSSAIWLMPAVNGVLFAVGGAVLAGLVRSTRSRWIERTGCWVLAVAAFVSLSEVTDRIHWAAWLILAFGLATVTVRWMSEHPQRFAWLVRRSLPVMIALMCVSSLWTLAVPNWQERRALRQLPEVAKPHTNVLLIVLDTVPAKRLSVYGYDRPTTPFLNELARESVVFDQAHATAPWTLPSHASLFTGRQSCELLTDYVTPLQARYPTLAEHLQGLGYATAAFVANWHYCVPEFGLNRGFLHYEGPRTWSSRALLATTWSSRITRFVYHRLFDRKNHLGRKSAAVVNAECLRWLDQRPDQPFFIFLNYMDTHTPYTPPRAFERRFGPELPKDPGLHNYWYDDDFEYSSAERQRIVDAYDSALAYLDDQLAKLFGELKRRKLDESTLVIVVGDHGEMLGEHDLFEHANCLYSEVVRVPLLVRLPSQGQAVQARRDAEPVSIADVPATIADVLRLTESPFPGTSLLSAPNPSSARRPVYFEVERNPFAQIRKTPASDGDMQGVVVDGMYYIRNANGREEVYDLERDPGQKRDLSQMVSGKEAVERSRRIVEKAKRLRPRD